MLRLVGVFLVVSILASAAHAQRMVQVAPETEHKPLVTPPKLIRFVEAAYPGTEGEEPIEAVVELDIVVGKDGLVTEASVARSAGEGFDAAALAAARQFVFEPARKDWEPIASRVRYRYVFELQEPPEEMTTGWLSGAVLLAEDDSPAGMVTIEILNERNELIREIVSGPAGTFVATDLEPGKYEVNILGGEYGNLEVEEEIVAGQVTQVIYRLGAKKKSAYRGFGETAVIEAPPREVVKRTIDKEELTRIPGTRGDALRAVELLPGVARPPFGIGLLIVRGSAPQDSESFIDGVPVPLIYHFGGLTSIYNSYMLEKIDFYPGNFSVRYGRRTGGILEVTTRDPARDRIHGVAEISIIDTFVTLEGPITDKISISGGLRRSLLDLVFPAVAPDDIGIRQAPVYLDYQFKLNFWPTKRDRVRISAYGSNDRLDLILEEAAGDDPAIRGNTQLATSFYNNQIDWTRRVGEKVEQELAFNVGPNKIKFALGNEFRLEGTFIQTYGRGEWRYQITDRVRLIAGLDVYTAPVDLTYVGPQPQAQEGAGSQQGSLAGQEQVFADVDTTLFRPGVYLESDMQLGKVTRLILGLRVDHFSEINATSVDPRLTTIFTVAEDMRVKLGVGIFSQPPELQESDPGIGNPGLDPIKAVHLGAGWEYDALPGARFGIEGFYKYLWDRAISTPNGEEPFYVTGGIGRIYGAEFSIHIRPATGRQYFGYLSYTLSRSERKDGPLEPWRLFDFDQTHILTAAFVYNFPRNWEIGGTFRVVSGNPSTPVIGSIYDALNDVYIPIDGRVNTLRNPLFHQLNVRVQKKWIFDGWKLAVFVDIQNAYNQQNQEGIIYNYDFSQQTPLLGLPIIPSLGIRGEL
ncbi:MAG: TonB-dependent receptor [Deltaproteobacteria bacterium]|nr:TonB-dependent receptor [Deltaproteobacteria bacterium]